MHSLPGGSAPQLPRVDILTTDAGPPEISYHRIGHIRLAVITGDAVTIVRRAAYVPEPPTDEIQLRFIDLGRCVVRQDGREAHLEQGEFTLLDTARPFKVSYPGPFAVRIFQFPKAALGLADRDLSVLTATPLRQDHALSAFLIPFLRRLSEESSTLHPQTREQLAHNVTGVLTTLITDHLQDAPLEDTARRTLVMRVKSYILDNLALPELSPQLIAVEHNISVRYLHKLFASESTTLSRWILRARLDRCRRDLATRAPQAVSIAGVAQRWGFTSPARFSRVFRDAYGMSPREWQATAASQRTGRHDAVTAPVPSADA